MNRLTSSVWAKTREEKREAVNALNLPALEGTPKQVSWAEDIRTYMVYSYLWEAEGKISRINPARRNGEAIKQYYLIRIAAAIDAFKTITSAKEYIDHNRESSKYFLETHCPEYFGNEAEDRLSEELGI